MSLIAILGLVLPLWAAQTGDFQPAYEREGDRMEQAFQSYRDKLSEFFTALRGLVEQQPVNAQLFRLQDPAPVATLYGYGVLPRITDAPPVGSNPQVASFSYSWAVTETYIKNEGIKLDQVKAALANVANVSADDQTTLIANAVRDYRKLLADQRTVEQYIQYNRFWQRSRSEERRVGKECRL